MQPMSHAVKITQAEADIAWRCNYRSKIAEMMPFHPHISACAEAETHGPPVPSFNFPRERGPSPLPLSSIHHKLKMPRELVIEKIEGKPGKVYYP